MCGIIKCRIVYDKEIKEVTFQPYTQKPIRSLVLVEAGNIEYPYKYLDRSGIVQLQKGHQDYDEIILVKNGCITDTSYSNLAFLSGDEWFTPAEHLLNGTCRQRLVDQGALQEIRITPRDLFRYSHVSLINAMLDLGEVVLPIKEVKSLQDLSMGLDFG